MFSVKESFRLPDWIDPDTWKDYEQMRLKIKKPMTDAARKLAIRRLVEIYNEHGHPPQAVLEQSILNAWQGIWPLSMSKRDQRDEETRKELNVGRNWISDQIEALAKRKAM